MPGDRLKLESVDIKEISFNFNKDISELGDCHNWPLSRVEVLFSNRVKNGLIFPYAPVKLSYLNESHPDIFLKFLSYYSKVFTQMHIFSDDKYGFRSYVKKSLFVVDSIGQRYIIAQTFGADSHTSHVFLVEKGHLFKDLGRTQFLPCGS
ncbi:MAG: hypothetical protein N4A33_00935 [Bacteriovoracaceae bacterium]|nr:hypothetical protein [Bacteriovoracaceae bacterium]